MIRGHGAAFEGRGMSLGGMGGGGEEEECVRGRGAAWEKRRNVIRGHGAK